MLDIPSLERRWLKYKIKHFLPYVALIVILLLIPIIMISLYSNNNASLPDIKKENNPKKIQLIVPMNEEPMVLEPSMQFIQSLPAPTSETNAISPSTLKITPKAVISQKSAPPIQSSEIKPITAVLPVTSSVIQTKQTNKPSSINRDTAAFDIHEIEERFKNNSNPHLGLYIARYHYDHTNYSEAYNYALKTNAINNTIEESWLIFIKSLIKLGKTDQAKKTLQLYISQSNSDSAKILLDSLEKEESK
ncbi:MAG: hypothetical protein PHQ22_05815 [Sulfuricurvum sp.]|nr:hypothetical protein [Sulfuricurvum sp.]MDD5386693.1 hypothetical protein [Sulfuricurvum sp.]